MTFELPLTKLRKKQLWHGAATLQVTLKAVTMLWLCCTKLDIL